MSFFSRSSGRRHHSDNHRGSNYYKREGLLTRILDMFGSLSRSSRRHSKHYSHDSHHSYHSYPSNQGHGKRRYKSSWS